MLPQVEWLAACFRLCLSAELVNQFLSQTHLSFFNMNRTSLYYNYSQRTLVTMSGRECIIFKLSQPSTDFKQFYRPNFTRKTRIKYEQYEFKALLNSAARQDRLTGSLLSRTRLPGKKKLGLMVETLTFSLLGYATLNKYRFLLFLFNILYLTYCPTQRCLL